MSATTLSRPAELLLAALPLPAGVRLAPAPRPASGFPVLAAA